MQTPLPDATSLGVKTDEDDTDAEGRSLNTTGKGKSPLHIALESVLGVMRGKILSGPSDFIGVLIYNLDVSSRRIGTTSFCIAQSHLNAEIWRGSTSDGAGRYRTRYATTWHDCVFASPPNRCGRDQRLEPICGR